MLFLDLVLLLQCSDMLIPYILCEVKFCVNRSPGYGITLVAETTNGSFLAAEACSHPPGSPEGRIAADDLGVLAARKLLEEIYKVRLLFHLCFRGFIQI
jgi:RNA 3'-terminal phosphate cyclase